jgi:predicted 2-oxoglutarate/Fe(II)-dependent dioxygenase YbiX
VFNQVQVFSKEECTAILERYATNTAWTPGAVGTQYRIVEEVSILHDEFIFDTINKHTTQLGLLKELVLLRYTPGGKYNKHKDSNHLNNRIYSFSIPLNVGEYKGGQFFLEDKVVELKTGRALIFNSSEYHGVKPVEQGIRFVIVGWIHKNTEQKRSII